MENISELGTERRLGDLNIFTSNLDSDIEADLKTAYDLKRQFLKVPNRLSMRGQMFCQGSAIPFILLKTVQEALGQDKNNQLKQNILDCSFTSLKNTTGNLSAFSG